MKRFFSFSTKDFTPLSFNDSYIYHSYEKIREFLISQKKENLADFLAKPEIEGSNVFWNANSKGNLKAFLLDKNYSEKEKNLITSSLENINKEFKSLIIKLKASENSDKQDWGRLLDKVFSNENNRLFYDGDDIYLVWGWTPIKESSKILPINSLIDKKFSDINKDNEIIQKQPLSGSDVKEDLKENNNIKTKKTSFLGKIIILQGASMDTIGVTAIDGESVEEKSGQASGSSTENLIQQRYHFLDNLNFSFQKLDNDLQSISSLQTEMLNARSKIFEKKEQALEKKVVLEENGSALKEECEKLESDLEISVREEEVLTLEYAQLINKVEGSIVLSDDIDRILFSSLTNVDE